MQECIRRGICKVNYATDLRIAFTAGVKQGIAENPESFDPKKYLAYGRKAVEQCVRELIRILRTPEEEIVLDATGKKNGRGAYLCHNDDCLLKAFKSKGLDRAFKMAVPKEVYEKLREEFKALER